MAEKELHNCNRTGQEDITTASSDIAALINAMQSFHQQQIKVMTKQHRIEREQHKEEMA